MFFPRLRRQAKWMFVFLALVFGVGFVAFGVGSNAPSGLGDVFSGIGGATGQPSVSDAREKVEKNPQNPEGYRQLVTALQAEDRDTEAIAPLKRYLKLRPNDVGMLNLLAAIHLRRAETYRAQGEAAQQEQLELTGGDLFRPSSGPLATALQPGPISSTLGTAVNERLTRAYTNLQAAYQDAAAAYKRLAAIQPNDSSTQLQLAQTAQASGDTKTAIAAYQRVIRLSEGDKATVDFARQQIQQLRAGPVAPSG